MNRRDSEFGVHFTDSSKFNVQWLQWAASVLRRPLSKSKRKRKTIVNGVRCISAPLKVRAKGARRNYSAMVENIDRWVGTYLDKLEKRGEPSNTLIVFSSDHGEMLGDRDEWGKSKPWHPSASVPLIISGPGVQQGIQNDQPMTILDFTATFLDYAGLETPSEMDSRSFKALLQGQTNTHRNAVISGLNNWRLVYDGRFKLIRYNNGDTSLFDLENDLHETINLTDNPDHADIQNRLNTYLPEAYQIK